MSDLTAPLRMAQEIERLKAENQRLREQRRFEAAKWALGGLRAAKVNSGNDGVGTPIQLWSSQKVAAQAVSDADALLEALESETNK